MGSFSHEDCRQYSKPNIVWFQYICLSRNFCHKQPAYQPVELTEPIFRVKVFLSPLTGSHLYLAIILGYDRKKTSCSATATSSIESSSRPGGNAFEDAYWFLSSPATLPPDVQNQVFVRMNEISKNEQVTVNFPDIEQARQLFGERNSNLERIAAATDTTVNTRGSTVFIQGDSIAARLAENVLEQLYGLLQEGYPIHPNDIDYAVRVLSGNDHADLKKIFLDTVYITSKKTTVAPKSPAQKEYIDAMRKYDIVFGIGPAGTGKTYLAMAMAVSALTKGDVDRIILTRPAVEAGEELGFLPGDLAEKVNPYLRPLYDALHDMMRFEKVANLMQKGAIEVAPLAFMRGRTLNDSFIILDEAQNTTSEQMKMFLTRIGFNSKAVITGDITQIDLPPERMSGLVQAKNILQGIKGIKFVFFSKLDVVRHRLVQGIINAYEQYEASKE
jgi:phosphate starvation-inducible PhoH-like protein